MGGSSSTSKTTINIYRSVIFSLEFIDHLKYSDVIDSIASKYVTFKVCWAPDTEEGNLAFYSVSIDGKINYWILNQSDLSMNTVMTLFLDRPPIPGPDGTIITLKGSNA